MHQVVLTRSARLSFESADAPLQKKLDHCFQMISMNPRVHNNIKVLKGRFAGYLRFRAGDWRIIYRIDDASKRVIVVVIANRKDVYE